MKNTWRQLLTLCLTLAIFCTVLSSAAQAAGGLVVTSYESSSATIIKGGKTDLTLHLKNTGLKTSAVSSADVIDVSRLVDSFSGGTKTVKLTSSGDAPLEFDVVCTGLTYSGSGKAFRLMVGVGDAYESVEIAVSQTVEAGDTPAPAVVSEPPAANPQPLVQVIRSDLAAPVQAGQEFAVTLKFRNLSTLTMKSPVVSVTASDGLVLTDSVSSYALDDIPGKKVVSVEVRLRAAEAIVSPSQSLTTELKFYYSSGSGLLQGSSTDRVTIPAVVRGKDSIPAPTVIVTRGPVASPLSPGQELPVTISFRNAGQTALRNPAAVFSTSDALTIIDNTSTRLLPDIAPGATAAVTVNVRVSKEVSTTTQTVNVDLKYSYQSGDSLTGATASDRVTLSTNPAASGGPAPNLIISSFTYGGTAVASGASFPLELRIMNTSTAGSVENIVASVDTGDSFSMDGSTNTAFFRSVGAGGEKTWRVPMRALPAVKTGAHGITVSFKYEYMDGSKRTAGTGSVLLSVPVYQPDRLQISAPAVPAAVNAGEELTLSLNYVNKGKGDLSNVEASITVPKDSADLPVTVQNLGNFEPGKSGTIGFALTPRKTGTLDVTLTVTYEDANAQVKTWQRPVQLTVQEAPPPAAEAAEPQAPAGPSAGKLALFIGAPAGLAAAVIVLLVRKKRKAAAAVDPVLSGWEDWPEDGAGAETPVIAAPDGKEP